jgi:hypothetical protein
VIPPLSHPFSAGVFLMNPKLDSLERTVLELGSELFRVKHRMDEVDRSNGRFKQALISLKKLLDEKGIVSADDFEEIVALDSLLESQSSQNSELLSVLSDDLKKVVN